MKKKTTISISLAAAALLSIGPAMADTLTGPKKNVIDEVAWIVGDNAIYKSEATPTA